MTYTINSHVGHRRRLREKFYLAGTEKMLDYEALELLLTYAIIRRDVKPLAKELIAHFGGLNGVLDAPFSKLRECQGLGAGAATLIKLVKDLCNLYLLEQAKNRDVMSSPQVVANFVRAKLAGLPHESFLVIFLNIRNEILHYEILNEGTIDQVAIYPRRIVEKALMAHAASIILAHNHPSGHVEPSDEDKQLTRAVREAGQLIDLKVLDHLIVGNQGFFSFSEHGFC